ncbi:MAG: mandelate racemase/muconate lactonizing enzyme family protein [Planctomycetaceae bacterium]|nr:mandelate racemase/muconate lactonizing enzyme family protein [Planctomycetaceae bacterium]
MPTFSRSTDIAVDSVAISFLPVTMRMPLKFGAESITEATTIRVAATVRDADGKTAVGWGETPLAVTWAWPSPTLSYQQRLDVVTSLCHKLAQAWVDSPTSGHPIEVGHEFVEHHLPSLLEEFNASPTNDPVPHLAALIATSAFDLATHDAYGKLHQKDIFDTYTRDYLSHDLSHFLTPADDSVSFAGKYPSDYLVDEVPQQLPVWHLVGGLDPLEQSDTSGAEPDDGYPVTLRQWIQADGLNCLKIKLRGNDAEWDYNRIVAVGDLAIEFSAEALSADFNCTVTDPAYVNQILDRLRENRSDIFDMLVYVEQPFPYDLEQNQIDVTSVSERKPLFLDESAHDWKFVALGKQLGWTGVALKTCKTQTGALLSLCWAKAHGMPLMVQDLTNLMLAQIPHVRLAAHAGTIMGVESNGMQFYPAASAAEAEVHPGLFQRTNGMLDLSSIHGPGFGYRVDEIERDPGSQVEYRSQT